MKLSENHHQQKNQILIVNLSTGRSPHIYHSAAHLSCMFTQSYSKKFITSLLVNRESMILQPATMVIYIEKPPDLSRDYGIMFGL